jgi:hypothetical protein
MNNLNQNLTNRNINKQKKKCISMKRKNKFVIKFQRRNMFILNLRMKLVLFSLVMIQIVIIAHYIRILINKKPESRKDLNQNMNSH